MTFYMKSIVFVFLFLLVHFLYAQDTLKINRPKRNAFKIGVSAIPTKIFFSYEHAFTKHISFGGMASYGGTNFIGYTCNLFSRYYFSKFNESGWLVEARGSYGHYNPVVYTTEYNSIYSNSHWSGEHQANIDYWNIGVSGGYKVFLQQYGRTFFEFIGGLHAGNVTFGKDDNYFHSGGYQIFTNDVQSRFNQTGPGFPLHFIINFGVAF